MNTKLKKSLKQRLISAIMVFIGMFIIAGCSGNFYGSGTVVDKNHMTSGYRAVSWSNTLQWQGECYELVIRESETNDIHKSCVSERVWYEAMLDHKITISEDYK